jgi:hypothetical protein
MREHWVRRAGGAAALVALVWGAALAGDDEGAVIKTPQKVRLQFTNNSALTGTLLSVTDKEVEFQPARPGSRAVKYKVTQIKSIRTADELYVYNADKGAFESQNTKPGKDTPGDARKDKAGSGPVAAGLQFVVADGTGERAEAAKADAQRAAVYKVVRYLVDSVTLAKEEKTIADQVLSEAGKLVKGARVLSTGKDGNKVRVRLYTGVDRRAVAARLEKAGLKVRTGQRGVPTAEDIRAHGPETVSDFLSEVPWSFVGEAQVVGSGGAAVKVDVRLRIDWKVFSMIVANLNQVLEVLKLDKNTLVVETELQGEPGRRRSAGIFRTRKFDKQGWVLWTVTDTDPLAKRMVWQQYLLDIDYNLSVAPLMGRQYLLITALGANGQVVGSELVSLEPPHEAALASVWHKWGWADLLYDTPERQSFYVTAMGISLKAAKDLQILDVIPERKLSALVNVAGPVAAVTCAVLVLPD